MGWQNTPPGAAALALAARVPALPPDTSTGRWPTGRCCRRGAARHAPYVFAAGDLPVFTLAMAPRDDAAIGQRIVVSTHRPVARRPAADDGPTRRPSLGRRFLDTYGPATAAHLAAWAAAADTVGARALAGPWR